MRPKDEPIAQKGPLPIPILRPTVLPPLIFDADYPLTRENSPPILRAVRSNVLSIRRQCDLSNLRRRKMGLGGFSLKRATGISRRKASISRSIGIPLTKSGRQRKIGKMVTKTGCLFPMVMIIITFIISTCLLTICFAAKSSANHSKSSQKQSDSDKSTSLKSENSSIKTKSGCCSHHNDVCGCKNGRAQCCDGTMSPTSKCNN